MANQSIQISTDVRVGEVTRHILGAIEVEPATLEYVATLLTQDLKGWDPEWGTLPEELSQLRDMLHNTYMEVR